MESNDIEKKQLDFYFGTYEGETYKGVLPIGTGVMTYKSGVVISTESYGINSGEIDEAYLEVDVDEIESLENKFYFDYSGRRADACCPTDSFDNPRIHHIYSAIPTGFVKVEHLDGSMKITFPDGVTYKNVSLFLEPRDGSFFNVSVGGVGFDGFGDKFGNIGFGMEVSEDELPPLKSYLYQKEAEVFQVSSRGDWQDYGAEASSYYKGHILFKNGNMYRGYFWIHYPEDGRQPFIPQTLGGEFYNCRKKIKEWVPFDWDERPDELSGYNFIKQVQVFPADPSVN